MQIGPQSKIIDTSVIVDGRIVEIVESGFLEPPLVIPRFVLHEIQLIADSTDPIKRSRGRRALDVMAKLQERAPIEIGERDYPEMGGTVDAKLVRLARETNGKLVTNDYNLNRVAHVEGVTVLNINELANAVKPIVLPGEEMHVVDSCSEGKRAATGGRLPRRRDDDRGRERTAVDRRIGRRRRHQRPANRRRPHDFRGRLNNDNGAV